jgi:hypothetical protein
MKEKAARGRTRSRQRPPRSRELVVTNDCDIRAAKLTKAQIKQLVRRVEMAIVGACNVSAAADADDGCELANTYQELICVDGECYWRTCRVYVCADGSGYTVCEP